MRSTFLVAPLLAVLAGATALSACTSGEIGNPYDSSAGDAYEGDPLNNPDFAPAPGGIRRLLGRQYRNSIKQALGESAAIAADPPEDPTLSELETLAAADLALPPNAIDQYERSARAVAQAVIDDGSAMAALVPCVPAAPDDADCHRQVIAGAGHQLWRRPLVSNELEPIVAVARDAGSKYADFDAGVQYALMALLQSPYFLYTVELGIPDDSHPGMRKLTGPELATRLSLFLVDTTPDAELLDAAENGGLETEDQVREAARGLMKRKEARKALGSFYDVFFKLRDLPTTTKIPANFPDWSEDLGIAMRQESLLFFEDVVWNRNADYREIFTADYTFANSALADLYGLAEGTVSPGDGFVKVSLPEKQLRSGFLGHASHLTRYAHAGDTSPTRRGAFLSTALLCQDIPPPPPGVNTQFPAFDPGEPMTKKQYLEEIHHKASEGCDTCHALMDPLGYAMESYDGIGRFRTKDENGLPIDPSGELADLGSFADARALGQLMHDEPRAMKCIVSNLLRQAMGHKEIASERPAITAIQDAFEASGFKLQEALVEIVASPAFAYVGAPK